MKTKNHDLDLSLAVIEILTPQGYEWTLRDLAEACGVKKGKLEAIERKAKRNFLKKANQKQLIDFIQG